MTIPEVEYIKIDQNIHAGMWFEATYSPSDPISTRKLVIGNRYIGKVLWGGGFNIRFTEPPFDTYHGFLGDFKDFELFSVEDTPTEFKRKLPLIPTPEKPLFVMHRAQTPSMKNDNQVDPRNFKVRRSPGTRIYLRTLRSKIAKRMTAQGFSEIDKGLPVSIVAYVRAGNQDLDNMYTTVQEAFQSSKASKAFIPDDKQVKAFHPIFAQKQRNEEPLVIAFAWVSSEAIVLDKDCSSEEYWRWYTTIWRGRTLAEVARLFGA